MFYIDTTYNQGCINVLACKNIPTDAGDSERAPFLLSESPSSNSGHAQNPTIIHTVFMVLSTIYVRIVSETLMQNMYQSTLGSLSEFPGLCGDLFTLTGASLFTYMYNLSGLHVVFASAFISTYNLPAIIMWSHYYFLFFNFISSFKLANVLYIHYGKFSYSKLMKSLSLDSLTSVLNLIFHICTYKYSYSLHRSHPKCVVFSENESQYLDKQNVEHGCIVGYNWKSPAPFIPKALGRPFLSLFHVMRPFAVTGNVNPSDTQSAKTSTAKRSRTVGLELMHAR